MKTKDGLQMIAAPKAVQTKKKVQRYKTMKRIAVAVEGVMDPLTYGTMEPVKKGELVMCPLRKDMVRGVVLGPAVGSYNGPVRGIQKITT